MFSSNDSEVLPLTYWASLFGDLFYMTGFAGSLQFVKADRRGHLFSLKAKWNCEIRGMGPKKVLPQGQRRGRSQHLRGFEPILEGGKWVGGWLLSRRGLKGKLATPGDPGTEQNLS